MGEVADYLASKGCTVRQSGPTQFHTHCIFCGEDTNKRGRLYFQDDPMVEPKGLFKCFVCDERGAFNKLRKHFGDPILTDDSTVRSEASLRLLEAANTYFMNSTTPEVYKYLMEERGLELDTIENHRFGYDDGGLHDHLVEMGFEKDQIVASGLVRKNNTDFLKGCITIPYVTNGQVVAIRGKLIGGKYLTPPGNGARLFNVDNLHGATDVVICEGEMDSIVVEQMGYPAVGVPGANTWQNNWDNYVSGLDHIYICFDNDAAGQTGADKLASRFSGKAKVIQLPEGDYSDVSDWYVGGHGGAEDFDVLLKRSRGGLLCTVDDAFDEWLQVEGNPDLEGIKLGFSLLDEVLKPGITPGQVFVLLAKPGSGKTLFAVNVFHRMVTMQPEKKILFLSLEQTRGEWFERARRIHKFYDPWATEQDTIELYRNKLMIVDKNKITPQEMENILDQFEEVNGQQPDFAVVDYLGYWARAFKGESYERTSAAIMGIKGIAKERRIGFLVPHQTSRTSDLGEEVSLMSAKDSSAVEDTADFLAGIWTPDQRRGTERSERSGKVILKLLKSRRGGVGTQIEFQFAPATLTLVAHGEKEYARAVAEHRMVLAKDTFEQVMERHRSGDMSIRPNSRYNLD